MEARHDWWLRALRQFDESGLRDVTDRQAREAARGALDYLADLEGEVSDVDSLFDAIAAEGRVLTISDVEDLLEEYGRLMPDPDFLPGELERWLVKAKAERDGVTT